MARYEHLPIYKQAMDLAVHFEWLSERVMLCLIRSSPLAMSSVPAMLGGLIGLSYNMTMDNSFATGTVAGNSLYIGGLPGDANDGSIITRGLAANVVTLVSSTSLGALVGYSSGVSYTNNYHANDRGIISAIGQNLDTGGSNPPGTTGSNLAALQFVTSAGQSGLFTNWGTV